MNNINIFEYSLSVYFFFFLVCHSTIFSVVREKIFNMVPPGIVYIANCAFCFTFWISCALVSAFQLPFWYLLAAPVVNLLIDSLYRGLNSNNNN